MEIVSSISPASNYKNKPKENILILECLLERKIKSLSSAGKEASNLAVTSHSAKITIISQIGLSLSVISSIAHILKNHTNHTKVEKYHNVQAKRRKIGKTTKQPFKSTNLLTTTSLNNNSTLYTKIHIHSNFTLNLNHHILKNPKKLPSNTVTSPNNNSKYTNLVSLSSNPNCPNSKKPKRKNKNSYPASKK